MKNNKVIILVASHKPDKVYQDNVYIPIHVGRSISKYKEEMAWMIGDDTGDNISKKNPNYCELTAQYWAWKNLNDIEYIGLCHYRRYFMKQFTSENIDKEIEGYDIILSNKYYLNQNILSFLSDSLIPEDVDLFFLYMSQFCKNDFKIFKQFYMNQNWYNPANMFVCKKQLFNEFCEWQFKILNDLFQIIPISPYTREKRLMGYLAETLLPFYAKLRGWRIKEVPLISMIGNNEMVLHQSFLEKNKNKLIFSLKKHIYNIPADRFIGLTNDGLIDKINKYFT